MRILHIMAGNKHGGAETACIDMCIAMHEAGEDIAIITRPNAARIRHLQEKNIKTYMLPFGSSLDFYTTWRIKHIIQSFEPDIIQTWMSRAAIKTPRWKPSISKKPYKTFARLGNYYKMKYFRTIDYFISITPDIRTYLIKNGIEEGHVQHINNFAETEHAHTPISRTNYNTPENATLLLGLGRLHDDKAFDTLIQSVSEMPDNIHLWIAGEGPDRQKLEKLITDLNVQNRVKLLGWRNDRAALLQACDICMFTSRDEPFGTVFVQAWAQKTPVIVSNADGPRQFVLDGEDGLITPIDDKQAIIEAISKLENDAALKQKLIENGHKRYQNEFTKEKSVQAYLNFYQSSLS